MNLEDERLAKIESEKQNAISNSNSVYQTLNNQAENLYNQQQQYAAQYQQTQDEALDRQLANQTAKIEQQKQIATQNRDTEAKRARNDYQAYINPYGVNAESLASRGLLNSGLSETSQLGGYNAYQNRVASANKALQDAIVAYDNDINDAQLNNDVAKAQNALTKLEMQLKYAQSYYDTSSELARNSLTNQQSLNSQYANQYQNMLGQILNENKYQESIRQYNADLAEKQRQYNENLAYQKERARIADEQWQKEYELQKKNLTSSGSRRSGGSGGSSGPKSISGPKSTSIATGLSNIFKGAADATSSAVKKTANTSALVNKINDFIGLNEKVTYDQGLPSNAESTGRKQTLYGKDGSKYTTNEYKDKNGNYYVYDRDKKQYIKYR